MKNIFKLSWIAFLFIPLALASNPTGPASTVYRVPNAGGLPKFGAVDLSQTAATTNALLTSRGGTSITSSGAVGNLLQSTGSVWASLPQGAGLISNLGLASSVGSNLLTVDLKQADGSTNASASAPVSIGFRNSTLTTGSYTARAVTGALTINTVAVGATFGLLSGVDQAIAVYAIDNAGTVELALAGSTNFDEGLRYSTTAIGAGSTSSSVLYSTTARTNVAVRLIGRVTVNEATMGTYSIAPTVIALNPFIKPGTVVSSSSAPTRIEYATMTNNGSTCTTNRQSGSWITSASRPSLGQCDITILTWAENPTCTCMVMNNTTVSFCQIQAADTTPTLINLHVYTNAGASLDTTFTLVCTGLL